jgi:nicotinamidase-related amidase
MSDAAKTKDQIILLTIDPQFDFCNPSGSLFVQGADRDMIRLAGAVSKHKDIIDRIVCTKDAHRYLHIAHPIWWIDSNGKHPDFYTAIPEEDVVGSNPKWRATNPGFQTISEKYVQTLKKQGNYTLMIWPPHCLIGSNGFKVEPVLFEAFQEWEAQFAVVDFVTKGSNMFTEHYSAFKAEVFDPDDAEGTGPNMKLVQYLKDAKYIYIAGEALSHCVKATVEDIATHFGDDYVKKFVYLEDASSPVPIAKAAAEDFINKMTAKGMKITTTDKFLQVV